MKAIWKGSIGFGLVNIPVKLYSATHTSTLDLDMLDRHDKSRIRFERINENTRKEVPWENIVKGYYYNNEYVILEDEDFKEAAVEKSKSIVIDQFVKEDEIDTIYYENAYYLEPEKSGVHAYGLFREALKKSGKVGIATFVLRTAETLVAIKPMNNVLLLSKLRFPEEIRNTSELSLPNNSVKPDEMKIALALIDQFTKKFNIKKYKNDYADALLKIIKEKASGKKRSKIRHITEASSKTKDLMEQLRASLNTSKKRAS